MKIGLLVVGKKGLDVLNGLVNKLNITFVQSYNDTNVSDDSFLKIKDVCKNKSIVFSEGKTIDLKDKPNIDKIIIIGWQYLLNLDYSKCIVFHDSLLPEYKGWAPTVNYLINGSDYLAATAFQPTDEIDAGPIYLQKKKEIQYPIKIKNALEIVSEIYVELIIEIINKNIKPKEPTNKGVSFCLWRDNLDYFIDWQDSSKKINRFVDAVGEPYDGAKFKINGSIYKVIDCETVDDIKIIERNKHIGKILKYENKCPVIVCGIGLIKLTKFICDGKKIEFKKLKMRLK